jgi:hypothetical protein
VIHPNLGDHEHGAATTDRTAINLNESRAIAHEKLAATDPEIGQHKEQKRKNRDGDGFINLILF